MLNEVRLIGHLGKDPDSRYLPDGAHTVTLSLATKEKWRDKQGEKQERTEWHRIVCWGKLADVAATLYAMRAIERHGGAAILDRAFSGFAALPAPGHAARSWREVLGFTAGHTITLDDARTAYRRLATENHPDHGGDPDRMAEINRAWQQAQEAL